MIRLRKISFLLYLKTLLKKWVLYLGFIPYIYNLVSTYFPGPLSSFRFPNWMTYPSILLFLLIAGYLSWLELKNKVDEYLISETNFKVKPLIYELSTDKYILDIESKIRKYEEEIEIVNNISNPSNQLTEIESLLKTINLIGPFNTKPKKGDYEKWIGDLKVLKDKITNFLSENKNLFLFNLAISVDRYDENIDIKVMINNNSEFIEAEKIGLLKNVSVEPSLPFSLNLVTPKNINKEPFTRYTDISKKFLSCDFKYLKKDSFYYLPWEPIFIKINEEKTNLNIFFNSKYSNGAKEYNIQIKKSEILETKDLLEIKKEL